MRNKILISLALLATMAVSAQNESSSIRWKGYTPNGFCGNWEVSAGVGANFFFKFGDNENPSFGDLTDLSFNVSVAKWFNPIVGARINWQGPFASAIDINGNLHDFNFMFIHYDQLWNLTNWICGYKADRLYNAVLTTGMGYAVNTDVGNDEFAFALGLQNRFRVCDAWNIDLELQSMLTKSNFDQVESGATLSHGGWDRLATSLAVYVGATYKIPTRNWKAAPQCNKQDDGCVKRVNDLEKDNGNYKKALKDAEDRNNQLRKELDKARNAAQEQGNQPATNLTPKETQVSFTLFFNGDESSLTDEAKASIKTINELMKKADNNTTYTIVGYSDKDTGNPKENMELSKKRAENVRKALVNGGIDASRLKAEGKGDTVQPLGSGTINRCVMILQDK
ncbi:MAG: OmpA family protein [Bacteroidales bacterium]|jgi:outer membrane protein OmpA-like peptidoglycan-associated protein|nr:OmpA family protein [Bacteroidales bacterium]